MIILMITTNDNSACRRLQVLLPRGAGPREAPSVADV